MRRPSFYAPCAAAAFTALALIIGYRYADLTHHRKPPPPPAQARAWPGTVALRGTLTHFSQRVMTIRTANGTFAVILPLTTDEPPTCGHLPSWTPGEALEVRVPVAGDGTLLAHMVRDIGPCQSAVGSRQ